MKNQLHALAINQGLCLHWRLWTKAGRQQLEALPLLPYAAQRRQQLLGLLDEMERDIAQLDEAVEREARARPAAVRLMTHPGVGAGDGPGVCVDHRSGGALCAGAPGGQLSGADSLRGQLGGPAAAWAHQQIGIAAAALSAGGGGTYRSAI
ncbi:MAG: hypothetical protein WA655_19480 [Candidatus Korobacteraceae bacterium]